MGSYAGSSDWDDLPARASFQAFKPTRGRGRAGQQPAGPVEADAAAPADDGVELTARDERPRLNVILAFDTTGSMTPYVKNVQDKIDYLAAGLLKLLDVEIMLVGVGDHGDGRNMLQIHYFSRDLERLRADVASLAPTDGGDTPEALECLFKVLGSQDYDVPTVLIIISDSIPHGMEEYEGEDDGCPFAVDYAEELEELREKLRKVYLVTCSQDAHILALQRQLVGENGLLQLPNLYRLTNLVMAVCMQEVGELDYFMGILERQRGVERRDEVLAILRRA